jgi:hypothetical protein
MIMVLQKKDIEMYSANSVKHIQVLNCLYGV